MARLIGAGGADGLGHIDTTQGEFRGQVDVVADELLQLAGNADTGSGLDLSDIDPLNAPFVLYVNPYIGRDYFVAGSYNTNDDDGTVEEELRRIEQQRLTCGYTEARPFKTINRAIIEAGIITSKTYWDNANIQDYQLVSIILAPGIHTALNGEGNDTINDTNFPDWVDGDEPDAATLATFNPAEGGIILPRGVSICSLDLRKCTIRPDFVPAAANEAFTGNSPNNRSAIFRVTGQCYAFGFTFRDHATTTTSHHLLSAFEFTSEAQLDNFYDKIDQAIRSVANSNLDDAQLVPRDEEFEIVGPQPANAADTVDTTASASPYIYNVSIRSEYGMCGVLADGDMVTGFKSMVIAQFTGVSLQRDMDCWQTWATGTWSSSPTYANYIAAAPNDTRMRPERRSFHIRAINGAVIQEVSVFAIGQGIHHWVQTGGELTVTNSNSNFGGCAALAEDYAGSTLTGVNADNSAFPQDRGWVVAAIRRATDLSEETNNIRRIYLGTISSGVTNTATNIDLDADIGSADDEDNQPNLLWRDGYTTKEDSRVWVENPGGADYSSTFAATGWDNSDPNRIVVNDAFETPGGNAPAGTNEFPDIEGRRVYVRRLRDTRSVEERSYSLLINNTGNVRTPLRDYVIQTTTSNASISAPIPVAETTAIMASAPRPNGGNPGATIQLIRSNSTEAWSSTAYYRPGDRVRHDAKHWQAMGTGTLTEPTANNESWQEMFVHTETGYQPEDYFKNRHPIIVFDNDTENVENSTDLGYDLDNATATNRSWYDNSEIHDQLRSGTDYRGVHRFLMSMGFSADEAHRILIPDQIDDRDHDPADGAINGSGTPSGGVATQWAQWAVNFRRPSNIRLFGHAYEWSGYLNYSKALPQYQGELSPANKFTYYGTNEDGGKVYFSGFNEEGFTVSPRGIEDTQTGEILGLEEIGTADREIDIPTTFTELEVTELEVDELEVNKIVGDITWGNGEYPLEGSWTRQGTEKISTSGPLPRLPEAQTPTVNPVTADAALQTRGITRYTRTEEVDLLWTQANLATPPATAGVNNAAITPASLYSMVREIVDDIADAASGNNGKLAPVGMIGYFASATAPNATDNNGTTPNDAWLPCHGQSLNTFTYRRLHAVISDTFGGDAYVAGTTDQSGATTTFDLPDLRGEFIRGHNPEALGTGHDGGRTFGSGQNDAVERHQHTLRDTASDNLAQGASAKTINYLKKTGDGSFSGFFPTAAPTTTDDETRPVNVALMPMIKT